MSAASSSSTIRGFSDTTDAPDTRNAETLKIKDVLYKSKRFRVVTFGDGNDSRTPQEPVDAKMDALDDSSPFKGFPKIVGIHDMSESARIYHREFKSLPGSLQQHVIRYV